MRDRKGRGLYPAVKLATYHAVSPTAVISAAVSHGERREITAAWRAINAFWTPAILLASSVCADERRCGSLRRSCVRNDDTTENGSADWKRERGKR